MLKRKNFIFYLRLEMELEVGSPTPRIRNDELGVGSPLRASERSEERKNFIFYLPVLKRKNFIFYLQLERKLEVGSPPPESGRMKLRVGSPLRES